MSLPRDPADRATPPPDRAEHAHSHGGRRSAYADRDLTSGIPRTLWFLAWPHYVESSLQIVDQFADLVWAGIFGGFRAIAGIGAAQQYANVAFTLRRGIDTSMRAMVSRAIGMGDQSLASHVVLQAMSLAFTYSAVLATIGILLTEPLLRVLGLSEDLVALAAPYMRIHFIGQTAAGFQALAASSLQAAGDPLTPMKATFAARCIKIGLSPVLMFGLVGLPVMGLAGAAIATLMANLVAFAYLMSVLTRGTSRLRLNLRDYRIDWAMLKQMVKVGWPASLHGAELTLGTFLFGAFVAPFGDAAYAAFTVTKRVEQLASQGSAGIGSAAGTIVGQSIGAGKLERAKQTVLWSAAYGALVNLALALAILLFPTPSYPSSPGSPSSSTRLGPGFTSCSPGTSHLARAPPSCLRSRAPEPRSASCSST